MVNVLQDCPELRDAIVSFLDVSSLGQCARVSKSFQASVIKDECWESHLALLLKLVFDRAFFIEPKERGHSDMAKRLAAIVPISERRPLQSTFFLAWIKEWTEDSYYTYCRSAALALPCNDDDKIPHWMTENVPLHVYYKKAAHLAKRGQEQSAARESPDEYDYDGVYLGTEWDMFQGLPKIRLFSSHYDVL